MDTSHRDNQPDIPQTLCGNVPGPFPWGGLAAATLSWKLQFDRMDVATRPKTKPNCYSLFGLTEDAVASSLSSAASWTLGKSYKLKVSLQSLQRHGCFSGGRTIPLHQLLTIIWTPLGSIWSGSSWASRPGSPSVKRALFPSLVWSWTPMLNTRWRVRTPFVSEGFIFQNFWPISRFACLGEKKKKRRWKYIELFPIFAGFSFPTLIVFSLCCWFNAGDQMPYIAIFWRKKKKKKKKYLGENSAL